MTNDRGSIIITADEIVQGIAQYERSMTDLTMMLQAPKWTKVAMAFERWTERRGEAWQVLFIEAKHYINAHGKAPWEIDDHPDATA